MRPRLRFAVAAVAALALLAVPSTAAATTVELVDGDLIVDADVPTRLGTENPSTQTYYHLIIIPAPDIVDGCQHDPGSIDVRCEKVDVERLVFFGSGGADEMTTSATLPIRVQASGNGGSDELAGGSVADLLEGDAGDDVISGGDGEDELHGGGDRDRVLGDT